MKWGGRQRVFTFLRLPCGTVSGQAKPVPLSHPASLGALQGRGQRLLLTEALRRAGPQTKFHDTSSGKPSLLCWPAFQEASPCVPSSVFPN